MQLTKNVTIQIKLATNLVMFEKTQKGSKKKSKNCKQKHVSADARDLSKKNINVFLSKDSSTK